MLPNCSYNVKAGDCLADKRATHKLFEYEDDILNTPIVFTHKSCSCNEEVALSQRHQVDDGSRFCSKLDLWKHLRPLVRPSSVSTVDYIISRCSGSKRKLMEAAKESLQTSDVMYKDSYIKMFLKDDKYLMYLALISAWLEQESTETNKLKTLSAPRCIQYRNKRYCLLLAQFLHNIEENTYAYTDEYNTPVFAKARNLAQRGQDLRNKWDSFRKPKALLLDHTKFDAHCGKELLKLEQRYYTMCNKDPLLAKLLRWQLLNKGFTKNGTKYVTEATRMSGDQNTGLGNSVINYAIIKAFAEKEKLKCSIYVDGDDSVVIYEDDGIQHDAKFFEQFGMKTKSEYATEFEKVEFCQTRPVFDGIQWHCVRNPLRILLRTPWTVRTDWLRKREVYLASVGRCEIALGMGLPVGQYLGAKLACLSHRHMETQLDYVAKRQYVKPNKARVIEPTMECRLSYERAWDLSIEQQLYIEKLAIRLPTVDVDVEEFPFIQ